MAGKAITRAGRQLAYAMDSLSKNALADVLIDRAHAELGEDATDEQVAIWVQPWLDTVLRLRGDKPVVLTELMRRFDKMEAKYRARQAANAGK